MKLLLDTHIFLWVALDDRRLPQKVRRRIVAADDVYVSIVSYVEIAIKARLGKLKVDPEELLQKSEELGYAALPIEPRHVAALYRLPGRHNDPFDLLLVAQAQVDDLRLMTADTQIAAYSDRIILV